MDWRSFVRRTKFSCTSVSPPVVHASWMTRSPELSSYSSKGGMNELAVTREVRSAFVLSSASAAAASPSAAAAAAPAVSAVAAAASVTTTFAAGGAAVVSGSAASGSCLGTTGCGGFFGGTTLGLAPSAGAAAAEHTTARTHKRDRIEPFMAGRHVHAGDKR